MHPPIPPFSDSETARLRLLGTLELRGPSASDPQALLRQPKRLALFAFLLLDQEGGFCLRDRIVSIFWPTSDERRARGALRQGLSFIRASLAEDVLECRGQQAVRVRPGTLWCDAARFRELRGRGRDEAALELYRGPLLEGLHVGGSQPFDEWLCERRRRYQVQAAEGAWRLADQAEARGSHAEAAFWGKRALSLSPFDEIHVRRLMELLDRVGDRTAALRAYRGLCRELAEDFQAEPSLETTRLAREIRARRTSAAWSEEAKAAGRRSLRDRRTAERRTGNEGWSGPERRSGGDRRRSQRRAGGDRRGR